MLQFGNEIKKKKYREFNFWYYICFHLFNQNSNKLKIEIKLR